MIVLYRTRPWRLADGVDGQGGHCSRREDGQHPRCQLRGWSRGVWGAAVLLCEGSGGATALPQRHFLCKTEGWMHHCWAWEAQEQEKVSHSPPFREGGAAVYAEAGGSRCCWEEASRVVGRSPFGSYPLHGLLWAWDRLPPSPYLEGSWTWNSSSCQACRCCWLGAPWGAGVPLACHLVGGHLEPKLPGYPAESWHHLLDLAPWNK